MIAKTFLENAIERGTVFVFHRSEERARGQQNRSD
jgi:hypothetical protein